jgi:hypothetical protein
MSSSGGAAAAAAGSTHVTILGWSGCACQCPARARPLLPRARSWARARVLPPPRVSPCPPRAGGYFQRARTALLGIAALEPRLVVAVEESPNRDAFKAAWAARLAATPALGARAAAHTSSPAVFFAASDVRARALSQQRRRRACASQRAAVATSLSFFLSFFPPIVCSSSAAATRRLRG